VLHSSTSTADRRPNPRSVKFRPLRKVLPIPSYGDPADERCLDSSQRHQVFDQLADRIPGQRRNDGGAHAKAPPESARNVIFSAPLPSAKVPSRVDAFLARIEPQHGFAETDAVPPTAFGSLQDDRVHSSILAGTSAGRSISAARDGRFIAQPANVGEPSTAYNRPEENRARREDPQAEDRSS
jgi:hypothetical protein